VKFFVLISMWLALAGCKSAPKQEPIPVQPAAPTNESAVTALGKDLDRADHRVGAALVAIERNADKPKVVVAESRLAQSYLPAPPEGDVAFALARATKGSEIDYKKQMEFGRKLATAVNVAWERVEADQREAKRVSDLKDTRIKELTAEIERIKEESAFEIWTITGAALVVIGGLACAFASVKIGLPILMSGMLAGAVPHIISSQYFEWIAGSVLLACASLAIWWMYDKVRDLVNNNGNSSEQP
jgi:hypothetical protein